MTVEITDQNYEEILKSSLPIVIDFWAEWCGPCRMVGPIIEQLASSFQEKAIIGKLNVDNNPIVTAKLGIRNIPTILFIKNGEIVNKQVGAVPLNILEEKLNSLLNG